MVPTLIEAAEHLEQVMPEDGAIQEVVADKGYHSGDDEGVQSSGPRSYGAGSRRPEVERRSRRPGCRLRESAEGSWRART